MCINGRAISEQRVHSVADDTPNTMELRPTDALVVVDVQVDFLPGGALAVPGGDEVVAPLNRWIERFAERGLPIFITRDWHPPDHCSFHAQGGPWPPHCVMHTPGAEFAADLKLPPTVEIISKAIRADKEAYSDFEDTGFEGRLRELGVRRLLIGGLATEYCVLHTVRDARTRDFDVLLLADCIRAIEAQVGDGRRAIEEMQRLGAVPVTQEAWTR